MFLIRRCERRANSLAQQAQNGGVALAGASCRSGDLGEAQSDLPGRATLASHGSTSL
jgi:hypothetical protein